MEFIRELLLKNLQILRKERGLTQKNVADAIAVSQSSYGRWENGEWISPESLEKLAAFYGVRSSYFFHDPDLDLSAHPPVKAISYDEKLKTLDPHTKEHIESLIDGLVKKSL